MGSSQRRPSRRKGQSEAQRAALIKHNKSRSGRSNSEDKENVSPARRDLVSMAWTMQFVDDEKDDRGNEGARDD